MCECFLYLIGTRSDSENFHETPSVVIELVSEAVSAAVRLLT